jgi:molecular chaperone GrpE
MTGKSKEKTEAPSEEKEVEATPEEPSLEAQLEQAKAEAAENLDRWQRTFAEFDNYRKRTEKEMADFRKFANSGLVTELLNVVDDLGRALESAPDTESPLAVGVKAVRGNLVKILEAQGVSEVPTDKFDPNMHEALMVVDGEEDNKIAQVYQKGYMMNGRVLRFAKVVVTKKKEQEAAPEQDEKTAEENTEN